MSVSVVQHAFAHSASAVSSLSVSLPGAVTPGNTALVQVANYQHSQASDTVNDNQGNGNYTQDVADNTESGFLGIIGLYRKNDVAASGTFTATYHPTASTIPDVYIAEVSGLAGGAPTASAHGTGSNESPTTTGITPAAAGDFLIAGDDSLGSTTGQTITMSNGFTVIDNETDGSQYNVSAWGYKIAPDGTTSQSTKFTESGSGGTTTPWYIASYAAATVKSLAVAPAGTGAVTASLGTGRSFPSTSQLEAASNPGGNGDDVNPLDGWNTTYPGNSGTWQRLSAQYALADCHNEPSPVILTAAVWDGNNYGTLAFDASAPQFDGVEVWATMVSAFADLPTSGSGSPEVLVSCNIDPNDSGLGVGSEEEYPYDEGVFGGIGDYGSGPELTLFYQDFTETRPYSVTKSISAPAAGCAFGLYHHPDDGSGTYKVDLYYAPNGTDWPSWPDLSLVYATDLDGGPPASRTASLPGLIGIAAANIGNAVNNNGTPIFSEVGGGTPVVGGSTKSLAFTPAGVAAVAPSTLRRARPLFATPAGVAVVSPDLSEVIVLTSSPAGVAAITAAFSDDKALETSPAGIGNVTPALTVGGGIIDLAVTPAGVATVTFALRDVIALASSTSGSATVSEEVGRTKPLETTTDGVATATLSFSTSIGLADAVGGVASVQAAVRRDHRLQALVAGGAQVAGAIKTIELLRALATGHAGVGALITIPGETVMVVDDKTALWIVAVHSH